jgi:2-polyprenyl-6-methoxyphenol hydroxylase-like FAD-dependent oxidoreductase
MTFIGVIALPYYSFDLAYWPRSNFLLDLEGASMARHAEIAGAGFGGLVAAMSLLRRGWTVRVHERAPSLRSEGFGISIHANGQHVFEELGVREAIYARSVRTHRRIVRNAAGMITSDRIATEGTHRVSRDNVVTVLANAVTACGGEIAFNSPVAAAEPEGWLVLEDGKRHKADLIVGADGYNSRVRESLGLLRRRIMLSDGAMRLVIPRTAAERAADPPGCTTGSENWSGTRRVVYGACDVDQIYMALSCLHDDEEGKAVPVQIAAWRRSFPYLEDAFGRVEALTEWDRVKWMQFQVIKAKRWSRGRVAIVGDAAHAMPPNLGQGGGCAVMNAFTLAIAVNAGDDMEVALRRWEATERPLTEHTQRWSRFYGMVTLWPEQIRDRIFGFSERSRWLRSQLDRTARYIPKGA